MSTTAEVMTNSSSVCLLATFFPRPLSNAYRSSPSLTTSDEIAENLVHPVLNDSHSLTRSILKLFEQFQHIYVSENRKKSIAMIKSLLARG